MLTRAALAAVAAATALVVPGAPAAQATSCAPPTPQSSSTMPVGITATDVQFTKVTRSTTYGNDAVVQGQVVTSDGAVPGAEVHLWQRPAGGQWSYRGTTTADDESGVFSFCGVLPEQNTDYRVEYHGDVLHAASEADRTVAVKRHLGDTMRKTSRSTFALRGEVTPRYDGVVLLQHKVGRGAWSTVKRTQADDAAWSFRIKVAGLHGKHAWRAVVPADRDFARSPGGTWTITFR